MDRQGADTVGEARDPVISRLEPLLGMITAELTSVSQVLEVAEDRVRNVLRDVCKELNVYAEGCDEYGETCNIYAFCNKKQYTVTVRLYVKGEVSDITSFEKLS